MGANSVISHLFSVRWLSTPTTYSSVTCRFRNLLFTVFISSGTCNFLESCSPATCSLVTCGFKNLSSILFFLLLFLFHTLRPASMQTFVTTSVFCFSSPASTLVTSEMSTSVPFKSSLFSLSILSLFFKLRNSFLFVYFPNCYSNFFPHFQHYFPFSLNSHLHFPTSASHFLHSCNSKILQSSHNIAPLFLSLSKLPQSLFHRFVFPHMFFALMSSVMYPVTFFTDFLHCPAPVSPYPSYLTLSFFTSLPHFCFDFLHSSSCSSGNLHQLFSIPLISNIHFPLTCSFLPFHLIPTFLPSPLLPCIAFL